MPFRIRDLLISIDPRRARDRREEECTYVASLCGGFSPVPDEQLAQAMEMYGPCTNVCPAPPSIACAPVTAQAPPHMPVPPIRDEELRDFQAQVEQLAGELQRRAEASSDPEAARRVALSVVSDLERRFGAALEEIRAIREELDRGSR